MQKDPSVLDGVGTRLEKCQIWQTVSKIMLRSSIGTIWPDVELQKFAKAHSHHPMTTELCHSTIPSQGTIKEQQDHSCMQSPATQNLVKECLEGLQLTRLQSVAYVNPKIYYLTWLQCSGVAGGAKSPILKFQSLLLPLKNSIS